MSRTTCPIERIDDHMQIRDFGFLRRKESQNHECFLKDQTTSGGRQPIRTECVDPGRLGTTALLPQVQPPRPDPYRWYLTIRGYLRFTWNLETGRHHGYPQYLFSKCCFQLKADARDAVDASQCDDMAYGTREYGTHLYVDYSGNFGFTNICKIRRSDDRFMSAQQYPIHDVIPKYRKFYSDANGRWEVMQVKAVFVFNDPQSLYDRHMTDGSVIPGCTYIRWWDRTGRADKSRFVETDSDLEGYRQQLRTMLGFSAPFNQNYWGAYVRERARLVITETIAGGRHNRTLVLGGSFVVVNAEFHLAFADSLHVPRRLRTMLGMEKNPLGFPPDTPQTDHPIVMLYPVPSKAETICWLLEISDRTINGRTHLMCSLVVPLHGWRIGRRILFLEWEAGLIQVFANQYMLRTQGGYRAVMRTDSRPPTPFGHLRSATFDDDTTEREFWPHRMLRNVNESIRT